MYSTQMVEKTITDYITNNYNTNSDISVSKIKKDIFDITQQNAAVEVKYNKIRLTNETTGKKEVVKDEIKSITIAYIDLYANNTNSVKRFEIFL